MAVANLIKLLCGIPYLEDSYIAKMVCFGDGAMELCMHEKAAFFLPVNVLTVWSPAFLATRHTTMCLYIYIRSEILRVFKVQYT